MAKTKTWKQTISPHLKKYTKLTGDIFIAFAKEKQKWKITTTTESNKLWNKNYKAKLKVIEKRMDKEYKRIWTNYFKKK